MFPDAFPFLLQVVMSKCVRAFDMLNILKKKNKKRKKNKIKKPQNNNNAVVELLGLLRLAGTAACAV